MEKSFTGTEFLKALSEGALKETTSKEGMVKPDGNDPKVILFSEGTSCVFWTKIPVEIIESVEYLTTVRCHDHEYPLVRLHFKEPPPENKPASVSAELKTIAQKLLTAVEAGGLKALDKKIVELLSSGHSGDGRILSSCFRDYERCVNDNSWWDVAGNLDCAVDLTACVKGRILSIAPDNPRSEVVFDALMALFVVRAR